MARVTVEDCINKVNNRFELILIAAERARSISNGGDLTVDRDNDKNPVVALREIALETIDISKTTEDLIRGLQRFHEDAMEEDKIENSDKDEENDAEKMMKDNVINDAEQNADQAGMQVFDGSSDEIK